MLKNIGVYGSLIISTMLVNSSALTVGMLLSTYSTSSYAQDEDKILKDLDNKYDISNPYRHNLESKTYDLAPRASRDMTSQLETMIIKSNSRTNTLDIKGTTGANADMTTAVKNANAVSSTQIMPSVDPTTNDVNVKLNKSRAFETYRDSSGAIKVRLKPGADSSLSPVSVSADEIYSSELNHGQTKWEGEGTYEDEDAFYQAGRDSNARLSSAANNTGEAVAYRTVLSNAQSGAQQTVPDAIMAQSYTTLDELETGGAGFFDSCGSTTVAKSGNLYAPNIEERFCQRLQKDNPFHCEVERKLRIPVFIEGDTFTSCGLGCYQMVIGVDKAKGVKATQKCQLYTESKQINVKLGDGIVLNKVTLDGKTDDHSQILLNDIPIFSRVNEVNGVNIPLPPTGPNANKCEIAKYQSFSADLTGAVTSVVGEGNNVLNFKMNTAVTDVGGYFAAIQFHFVDTTGEGFGQVIEDFPSGCYNATGLKLPNNVPLAFDGLAKTEILDAPSAIHSQFYCSFDKYQTIKGGSEGWDDSYLEAAGPFYNGDNENVSWRVNLNGYNCDPFKGEEVCTNQEQSDGSVVGVCRTWDEVKSSGSTCAAYEEKDECVEIKTECTDGFTIDGWNHCVNETVTYECDTGHDIDFEYETTESSCEGMLPCSGGECSWGEKEENENFLKAAAIANVMEQIPGEASCDVPGDLSTCRIFEGERQYCSWATASDWGNDCCEAPEGIDFLDYLNMTQMMLKFENQQMGGVFSEPAAEAINGAWSTVSDSVTSTNAWESVSSFYTSAVETVTGNVATAVPGAASGSAGAAASTVAEAGLGPMTQYIYQLIYDALPEELGKLMFSTAVSTEAGSDAVVTGLSDGMASAANFLGAVMFWYSMYQLAQLVGSLLTACDETDSDTALKLEMRQCYAVEDKYCAKKSLGVCYMKRQDYCCYGSILSRIVMEQAHVLLSKDMTECSGLTHEELQALDFNQIDLSEWIGVMIESNLIPESNQDDLSAGGRYENTEYRETPTERTLQRTSNAAEGAKAIKEKMNEPLDCSKYPRPQICEFGFTLGSEEGG
ncbi:conjugal transfer protein TraN [Pseudoalteromonas sp. SG44-1]|uniref:conjugal transfer protein TraN n=1 Tax=Pseudoalteromonas sp. SG44-1 TaxID=2760964 RepID=UPI00160262EE|nr:conjugal transfer protein TraN [Pseudoalteromonas sp. SG44-1]MBB1417402.1 conjugal transfer protein TraN [Pseudoalteromonas sp. SG44-1]